MNLFVCAEAGITFTAHIVKFHPPFCCDPYCCNPPWQLKAVMGWFSVYRSQNVCQTFLYARLKNGRIMPWQCPSVRLSVCPSVRPSVRLSVCPSVRPSVRPGFPDFSSTCFEISIWNLVYTFSRGHDMSSLSCITIGSLWPSLQPKVGQTHFLQSWPHKSR